jgi:hypothetical protein
MFEFTFELAWKTLKDLLFYQGFEAAAPREALRKGFEAGYLGEAQTETLLDAIEKRNHSRELLDHIDRQGIEWFRRPAPPL